MIYVSDKSLREIERKINEDLKSISQFFIDNDLVVNLKKGKTECVVFGTAKRLSTVDQLRLFFQNTAVHVTKSHKYLGVLLDSSLQFSESFNASYR